MSCEACCICEDVVVDVGVFQGRVCILPEAVEEEDDTERDCGGENEERA